MADWYDDVLKDVGVDPASTSDFSSNLSNDDIMESIGLALGDTSQSSWVPQTFEDILGGFAGITNTAAYAQRQFDDSAPKTEADKSPDTKGGGGILGRITDFVDKNKGLSEMLAKGIAGAALGVSNKKAAEVAAQSRMDELRLRNQQEMEKDQRTSASVSGLRSPTPGLIGRQLKRFDGSPVYQNGRVV